MGAVILWVVDRGDRLLDEADAHALHVEKHIRLIFKALSGNFAEALEILCRDGTQAGLRVRKLYAVAQTEQTRGRFVPGNAPRRDARLVKITAAEHYLIRIFKHFFTAGNDIPRKVLTVAVDGDDALDFRQLFRDIGKAVFQAAPLSAVDLMCQYSTLLMRGSLLEPVQMLRIAAVIDNDDMLEAASDKLLDDAFELFIRIKRRQYDRHTLQTFKFF